MTKNILLAVGWGLAVALAIILYIEMQTIHTLTTQVQEVQTSLVTAKENVEKMVDLEARYQELEAVVIAMEQARDTAVETSQALKEKAQALKEKAKPPEDFDATTLVKEMLGSRFGQGHEGSETKTAPDASTPTGKNLLSSMLEGEQGEALMANSLDSVVYMQYPGLYEMLNLDEDREESLHQLLVARLEGNEAVGMAQLRGEAPDMDSLVASEAAFEKALADLLSPEELKAYEAYQAELPERTMRQVFDETIGMFAPRLSEPVRNRTVDVLVEQLINMETDPTSYNPFSPENVEIMRARYEAAAVQLEGELDETDAAAARRFIEEMAATFDMMSEMMGSEAGDAETTE